MVLLALWPCLHCDWLDVGMFLDEAFGFPASWFWEAFKAFSFLLSSLFLFYPLFLRFFLPLSSCRFAFFLFSGIILLFLLLNFIFLFFILMCEYSEIRCLCPSIYFFFACLGASLEPFGDCPQVELFAYRDSTLGLVLATFTLYCVNPYIGSDPFKKCRWR